MSDSNVETVAFSAAELEILQQRMAVYRQAVASVNEWMGFLMRQHNVKEEDGWQLGETGFVRQVAKAQEEAQEERPWAEPVVVKPEAVMAANGVPVR